MITYDILLLNQPFLSYASWASARSYLTLSLLWLGLCGVHSLGRFFYELMTDRLAALDLRIVNQVLEYISDKMDNAACRVSMVGRVQPTDRMTR